MIELGFVECGAECCGLCCVAWLVMRSVGMELGHGVDSGVCGWCWGACGVGVRGIAGNWIGKQGAAAVAEALKQNSTLSSLDLGGECVGEEAAEGGEEWAGGDGR